MVSGQNQHLYPYQVCQLHFKDTQDTHTIQFTSSIDHQLQVHVQLLQYIARRYQMDVNST